MIDLNRLKKDNYQVHRIKDTDVEYWNGDNWVTHKALQFDSANKARKYMKEQIEGTTNVIGTKNIIQ